MGDVSFESSLDVRDNLYVHQETYLDGDVSMVSGLIVMGDVSFESSLDVRYKVFYRSLSHYI